MRNAALAVDPRVKRGLLVSVVAVLGVAAALFLGALAGDVPFFAIALGVAGVLTVASVLTPEVATLVVLGLLYSNAAVIMVKWHGVPYIVGACVPLLLVAPLAYLLIVRRQPLVITSAFPWLAAYFALQVVSTIFSSARAFLNRGSSMAFRSPRRRSVELEICGKTSVGLVQCIIIMVTPGFSPFTASMYLSVLSVVFQS